MRSIFLQGEQIVQGDRRRFDLHGCASALADGEVLRRRRHERVLPVVEHARPLIGGVRGKNARNRVPGR